LAALAALLVLLALYAARKVVAREALTDWLRSHGVASQVDVQGLDLGRFGGRVRVGGPHAPDFVAGDAAVSYGFRGLNFEVRSVTLRGPTLRARLHGGQLSLGALDPLVEAFRRKPPQPDTAQPRITIERGVLLLATDYGPVRLTADAVIENGRLMSLSAVSDAARLRGAAFDADLGPGSLTLHTQGARTAVALDQPVASLRTASLTGTGVRLRLVGDAPYPDLKRKRLDGALNLTGSLAGGRIAGAAGSLDGVLLALDFRGQAAGGLDDLRVDGVGAADLRSSEAASGGTRLGALQVNAKASDLRWSRQGGDRVSGAPQVTALLDSVVAGDLRLQQLRVVGRTPLSYDANGFRISTTASLDGRGVWKGLGAVKPGDGAELAAVKRAAQGFTIAGPAVEVGFEAGVTRVALPQALRIRPDRGGALILSGRRGAPVLAPDGGALRLALAGAGLPTLGADVRRLAISNGAVTAQGAAKVAGSIGPLDAGTLDASGTLRIANGNLVFTADRCAAISARKLDFGANDVERLTGRLCPVNGPTFTLGHGDWRLRARADGLSADAPFLQARITDASGNVRADQTRGRLGATGLLDRGEVFDTARETRFNPLRINGTANLADAQWSADFKVATQAGRLLGGAKLRHDTRDGRGGLMLDTYPLIFAEGGLQPDQLAPSTVALGSPAAGEARFTGRVDWTPAGVDSGGTLTVAHLDFHSAVGKVSGLKGVVAFTNLAPLTAGRGQILSIDSLGAIVPVTDVSAAVGLDEKALTFTAGEATVGAGRVRVERLTVPLAPDAPVTGVLTVDGVQLHDLVEASPFGDKVDLDARVSGRVPFQSQAGKVRIEAAELHAVQPGRLSINRQALSGVAATGSVSAPTGAAAAVPPNDTFTDFAYQAMENLAFDKLEAAVASRPDGRLGILAHIVGRHDPPQHQEIKLSLFDLIRRKFLSRPLPLPSDTGVDLTLDTTVNLDDLLADYADFQQLRSSRPVQPAPPSLGAKSQETPR
jgi:hypothetical protein